ncbi:MAG: H4MPT-linked C1 transfer pathway protein [Methanobacterium sp.]|nr:H4MPT-linked C1 transfer pathway protein [Methanobacterium sp.]
MKIAGFDIGGANTDLAVVEFDDEGNIKDLTTDFQYLPMWQEKERLSTVLIELLGENDDIDAVGVCMTAELVDAYQTKKDGVLDIAGKVKETFNLPIGFVGLNGMMGYEELLEKPLQVAAANWVATSRLAGEISSDCIMIDTGSTTTDIIPIKNGVECARGRSDLERLGTGELVYSGILRTNVAALVDKVPLDGSWYRVASELFATSADVHLVLGNILEEDYTCHTSDGAGIGLEDCMRRLARVMCSDLDVLTMKNIKFMAEFIHLKQAEAVSEALLEVAERNNISNVVTTGLGMDIIGTKACKKANMPWTGMDQLLTKEQCVVAPAVGTALLMRDFQG